MALLAGTTVVAGVTAYQLGYFDRPDFEKVPTLCKNTSSGLQFVGVIAVSTEQNITATSDRLCDGVLKGIKSLERGEQMLRLAADVYGTPKGSDKVRMALFGDTPEASESPRWGAGWAVAVAKFRDLRKVLSDIQEASELTEEIRVVRVEGPGALKATVPWRGSFTPVVGALVQWGRAYSAYAKLKCTADNGRNGEDGSICMEISVMVPDDGFVWVDYILLYQDTSELWDDAFPEIITCSEENDQDTTT